MFDENNILSNQSPSEPNSQPNRLRIIIIAFAVVVAGIILYVIATNLFHIGKVAVEIKYAPFDSYVYLNYENNSVNNTTQYLSPGTYHITVGLEGFKTIDQDVEITDKTNYLYGGLELLEGSDPNLREKYQKDYLMIEGIDGEESLQEAQNLTDEWPILKYLPITKKNYSIGSTVDEQGQLVVTIRAAEAQIDNAINQLRSLDGVTLSEHNIKIVDFKNELENNFIENGNSNPKSFLEEGYRNLSIVHQVNDGKFDGDYYYTTISVGAYAGYIPVNYRVILSKSGSSWKIIGAPYPVLTIFNTADVDYAILDAANDLSGPSHISSDTSEDGP